jgi:hypothetical protein
MEIVHDYKGYRIDVREDYNCYIGCIYSPEGVFLYRVQNPRASQCYQACRDYLQEYFPEVLTTEIVEIYDNSALHDWLEK